MIVKVIPEWCGHYSRYRLAFTLAGIRYHEYVRSEDWTRKQAREALDILENVYGLLRRNIRFELR